MRVPMRSVRRLSGSYTSALGTADLSGGRRARTADGTSVPTSPDDLGLCAPLGQMVWGGVCGGGGGGGGAGGGGGGGGGGARGGGGEVRGGGRGQNARRQCMTDPQDLMRGGPCAHRDAAVGEGRHRAGGRSLRRQARGPRVRHAIIARLWTSCRHQATRIFMICSEATCQTPDDAFCGADSRRSCEYGRRGCSRLKTFATLLLTAVAASTCYRRGGADVGDRKPDAVRRPAPSSCAAGGAERKRLAISATIPIACE
jgi:hypothetical protein